MTGPGAGAASLAGMTLLERAINYTLGSLHLVTPDALARPTPCRDWDLRALLTHLDDALQALTEAVDTGQVALAAVDGTGELVATLRGRARRLLRATAVARHPELVTIGGHTPAHGLVARTRGPENTRHRRGLGGGGGRAPPGAP